MATQLGSSRGWESHLELTVNPHLPPRLHARHGPVRSFNSSARVNLASCVCVRDWRGSVGRPLLSARFPACPRSPSLPLPRGSSGIPGTLPGACGW